MLPRRPDAAVLAARALARARSTSVRHVDRAPPSASALTHARTRAQHLRPACQTRAHLSLSPRTRTHAQHLDPLRAARVERTGARRHAYLKSVSSEMEADFI